MNLSAQMIFFAAGEGVEAGSPGPRGLKAAEMEYFVNCSI